MHIPRSCTEHCGKLKALLDWTEQAILDIKKWEDAHPEHNGWWARKNQMLVVQQTLFNLMCKDIYPTDSNDLAYAKHVLWVLTNRKRQLLERIEKCEDEDALKQMKSTLSKYKRNITKARKHLNQVWAREGQHDHSSNSNEVQRLPFP